MTKKRHSIVDTESIDDIIRDLIKKRGSLKGKLTLFSKFVQTLEVSNPTEIQKTELQERLKKIEMLFDQFCSTQDEIDLYVAGSQLDKELQERESFENQYYAIVAKSKCILKENSVVQSGDNNCESHTHGIKLPTITLPNFDGSYDQWLEFRDTFLSIVHNSNTLGNIQKFHYLRSVLSGNALQVIKALEFSAQNYIVAWDLLENRYNNNRLLVHNHVKALFTVQAINKESASQIRKLMDAISRNLRALNTLGEPTDKWDTLIIYIIVTKLDSSTEREWELYKSTRINSSSNKKPSLSDLMTFLKDRADFLETVKPSYSKSIDSNQNNHTKNTPFVKTHSHVSTQKDGKKSANHTKSPRYKCNLCSSNHPIYSCDVFLPLSSKEKLKIIEEKNLCRNCLRAGHAVAECWFGPCKHCNKKHNTLIHSEFVDANESSTVSHTAQIVAPPQSTKEITQRNSTTTASHTTHTPYKVGTLDTRYFYDQVLLSTALVEIADVENKYHTTRALLDNGSQHCFISKKLCKTLKIPTIQSTIQVIGVGNSVTQSTQLCEIKIRSKTNSYNTHINCLVLSQITTRLPSLGIDHNIEIPKNVQLADPDFHSSNEINLLIGADKFWDLLNEGLIRLPKGPYLQNTKLGWVISGSVQKQIKYNLNNTSTQCNFTQALDAELKRFWELEEVTSNKLNLTKEEITCDNLFKDTTLRDDKGRFSVRIPLKESANELRDTFSMAENRFLALERKLIRSAPSYRQMYCNFLKEYLSLGHMSRITEYSPPYYFMPHHGVFREHNTTTKLRVVFDASAKSTSGKSLNDIQFIGPTLQNDIFAILLRFRQFKYVACADIEKMYRQILVQPDQRQLQLILWREKPSEPLGIYQLNTVTYGTASAPYLSIRCLKQLALECDDDVIAQVISDDFYVDDLITGNQDYQKLLEICNGVSKVLESACFPLRKWIFNAKPLQTQFESTFKELALGDSCHTKTLGLGWFNFSDELYFHTQHEHTLTHASKRSILSTIAQIYDPLGLLTPMIVTAKIILQKLWLAKIGWDDPVPKPILVDWQNFVDKLQYLQHIRIPRYVIGDNAHTVELHIFCDSSKDAFGACAYIRSYTDNMIFVRLLCAKSKVAPVKPVSIPRLELCGALVGARLYKKIISSLRLTFNNIYFWSDSTVVLGWLRMPPSQLKPFVQNRVVEVNELTGDKAWFHVNGKQNPADLLSRGVQLDVLNTSDLWWRGPSFLHVRGMEGKHSNNPNINYDELPELKPTKVTLVTQTTPSWFPFERFSNFNRMLRAMAYIIRFANNCQHKIKSQRLVDHLSVDELNTATRILTRIAQQESYPTICDNLISKQTLKCPRNISNLNIFLDEHNIIRVGGRLGNSESFSFDKKHPTLLCSRHRFTRLLFQYKHRELLHAGPQLLLATIREAWWPLRGRNLAKQIVHTCVKCVRMKAKPFNIQMGNLPNERLIPGYPFMNCGVDYAGPLFMLNRSGRGAKLTKCYICLFVCFTTRAVHLELVTNLTTEAYLLALKRFISRRGKPLQIYSDNGTTFVGALKEFAKFLVDKDSDIQDYAANNLIKFTFIPPYSPHFGGLWEAGIKSCKFHLTRVVGNAHLTYEELSTVLAQIEAVLNSRPMFPLSSDSCDFLPLTPAHFLIGRPLTAPASQDLTTAATQRLRRLDRVEQMRQNFWSRWSKEYVSELQKRNKWQTNQDTLTPDTLVLVKEDNLPPLKWRLGRILQTFPGKDGIARVASIRTATGTIKRSYSKICPLPPPDEDNIAASASLEPGASKAGGMFTSTWRHPSDTTDTNANRQPGRRSSRGGGQRAIPSHF